MTSRFDEVMELCLKRGFLLPSCEIYNQMAGFYDYGPLGCAVKNRILARWRDFCVRQEGFVEIDGSTILKGSVLEASGHATQFVDPIIKCTKCKEAFRADHLVGEAVKGKFSAEGLEPGELDKVIKGKGLKCPRCGNAALGQVEVFNLMFKVGVGAGEGTVAYLRPETAQSIFCDFHRVFKAERERLPLGIAQIGKSYRNEISPRQGLLRMREFTQMEIEIFLDPARLEEQPRNFPGDAKLRLLTRDAQTKGTEDVVELTAAEAVARGFVPNKLMAHWLAKEFMFYQQMGIPLGKLRMRHMLPKETPFYSKANFDLEVETSMGWKETIGNAYRTDHDLSTHSKHSGKDLSVMTKDGRRVMPHCIEPSWGFDRLFYCIMEHAYVPKGQDREWGWLRLPKPIAPYTAIVCPLMNKDELASKAQAIYDSLMKEGLDVLYDASGNIGKRYARADEVGIPFAITIDYDTLNDDAVTVRDRDTTKQERVKVSELLNKLK